MYFRKARKAEFSHFLGFVKPGLLTKLKNRVFGKGLSETKICSCCKRMKVEEREAELDGVVDDKFTQSQI